MEVLLSMDRGDVRLRTCEILSAGGDDLVAVPEEFNSSLLEETLLNSLPVSMAAQAGQWRVELVGGAAVVEPRSVLVDKLAPSTFHHHNALQVTTTLCPAGAASDADIVVGPCEEHQHERRDNH